MDTARILITGGAGYVGSRLVPELLARGHEVIVYDLYLYGSVLEPHPRLTEIRADIRDRGRLVKAARDCDAVIHLACISNDPSFDLDPALGKAINYDAFDHVIDAAEHGRCQRLLVASSTAQYGIKPLELDVTEDVEAEPITDYARFKIMCERRLAERAPAGLTYSFVRPATLCGYAARLRLDLSVNILTIHALINKKIRIFGGDQMRPALNIEDMVRFYLTLLDAPEDRIHGQAFNVASANLTIRQIADMVRETLADDAIAFEVTPNDDPRSYHVNTDKMKRVLGFECTHSLADAVRSLEAAYRRGDVVDGLDNSLYYNIKRMRELELT